MLRDAFEPERAWIESGLAETIDIEITKLETELEMLAKEGY